MLSALVLMFSGVPIGFSLGMSALAALAWQAELPLAIVPQNMVRGLESFPLLAVPFFILAGEIMGRGGISQRLVRFANALLGSVRGGLGMGSVVASMIFAGVSGSGAADTAAIGAIAIPLMIQKGYPPGLVASLQASAGTLGPIIPPSIIMMIIYGSITGLSVGALFLAGFIPGILIGLSLIATCYLLAWLPGYEALAGEGNFSLGVVGRALWEAVPALLMPLLIVGGILGGIFTATEAGIVASVYGLLVAFFIYRDLRLADLKGIFVHSALVSSMAMFILASAHVFRFILARQQFPQLVRGLLLAVTDRPWVVMLCIIGFLLLIGCFMEVLSVAIIMIPTLYELARQFGFDQIHMALVVIVALMIGTVTPPVGLHLFITCGIANVSLAEASRSVLLFVLPMVAALLLVAFVPGLVLFLPRLVMR